MPETAARKQPPRKANRKPSMRDTRLLLGGAVKVIRVEARHMSQDALAQKAGLNPTTICRYENGTAYASYEAMCAIATALGVDLEAISYPVHKVYVSPDGEAVA